MEDRKNPWDDVPIEVLIEFEREKLKKREQERPRLYLPIIPPEAVHEEESETEQEHKIVIHLF
tara:strand:+ start:701 stop:889 length:189 start_codon:yes stop_codon:yes gene_type:complete